MADLIKLDADLDIIQKLDDEPNDVGGLSSAELKAEFDKAGNAIKTYLNDTLIPGIEGAGGEGGLVGEQIAAHNVAPDAHADIRQKITEDIGAHNVAPDAHADIRQEIADNKAETDAAAQTADAHIANQKNPHKVTWDQVGADKAGAAADVLATARGTVVVADCYDEAASPTSAPNTWYVSKDTPRPSGEAGMTIDVRWKNGHAGGLGYSVKVVWGAPDGPDNETILSGISVTNGLTGEVSIPVEGTIRYQLINRSDRLNFKYVSGPVVSRQYSSATDAAVADKQVPGLSLDYLPGMEIYVQLDAGNTAATMRLVPSEGPTLPVYGNGVGAKTGDIPAGYVCHLVNAEDHWQMLDAVQFSTAYTDDKPVELPMASEKVLGGVKAKAKTVDDVQEVHIDSDGMLWTKQGGGSGGGAVTTVFGRKGDVKAQKGDYTAEQVGARPDTWNPVKKTVITPHGGSTVADMTASEIIDAARTGTVEAEYTDPGTGELRTYQYFKQMPDGRAVFAVNGYIEKGVPKQTLIYVDYAGNVTTETRDADMIKSGEKGAVDGVATLGSDGKVPAGQLPEISSVKHYEASIGINWVEDPDTGVKSQTVNIVGIKETDTAQVDHRFANGADYAAFVEAENQYLDYITNGYAETVDGGIKFFIFGEANTVGIPIIVEVS